MYCTTCGSPLMEGAAYCSSCGAPQTIRQQPIPPENPPFTPTDNVAHAAQDAPLPAAADIPTAIASGTGSSVVSDTPPAAAAPNTPLPADRPTPLPNTADGALLTTAEPTFVVVPPPVQTTQTSSWQPQAPPPVSAPPKVDNVVTAPTQTVTPAIPPSGTSGRETQAHPPVSAPPKVDNVVTAPLQTVTPAMPPSGAIGRAQTPAAAFSLSTTPATPEITGTEESWLGTEAAPLQTPARDSKTRRTKTSADITLGLLFIPLGLAACAIYLYYLYLAGVFVTPSALLPLLGGFSMENFILSFAPATNVLGVLAGFLLTLGGIFSLSSGRGRPCIYAAFSCMMLVVILDILHLSLLYLLGETRQPLVATVTASAAIYGFEVAFVAVVGIGLIVKRRAKKAAIAAHKSSLTGYLPNEDTLEPEKDAKQQKRAEKEAARAAKTAARNNESGKTSPNDRPNNPTI